MTINGSIFRFSGLRWPLRWLFCAGRRLEVTLELLCLKHATRVTGVGCGPASSPALMHLCSPGSSESTPPHPPWNVSVTTGLLLPLLLHRGADAVSLPKAKMISQHETCEQKQRCTWFTLRLSFHSWNEESPRLVWRYGRNVFKLRIK